MPASRFHAAPEVIDGVLAALAKERDYSQDLPGLVPPWPTREQLLGLIELAFWASLLRDEQRDATFTLTWCPPREGPGQFCFAGPIALSPQAIAQLAPVLRAGKTSLGVTGQGEGFAAWGILDVQVPVFVVLEALEPGLIVVRYGWRTLALFARDQAHLIGTDVLTASNLLRIVFPPELPAATRNRRADALARVALAMRSAHHGGTLLMVRGRDAAWERSIQQPIWYEARPNSGVLQRALEGNGTNDATGTVSSAESEPESLEALQRALEGDVPTGIEDAVEFVASLSAVDGAVIVDDELRIRGFGAKITAAASPDTVLAFQAVGQPSLEAIPIEGLGGTRHQSAARFVFANRQSVAIVASHDGDLTIMGWFEEKRRVVAIQQTHASLL